LVLSLSSPASLIYWILQGIGTAHGGFGIKELILH
jgi:hypothetical protein